MAGSVGVGAAHHVDVGGVVGGGRVHLLAVNHEIVTVTHGPALQSGQVGPGLGLGESQREDDLAANHAGDEILFLFLGASGKNGRSAAARAAHGDTPPHEFFFNDVLVDAAAALASVLLRPTDADPALIRDLLHQLAVLRASAPFFAAFHLV